MIKRFIMFWPDSEVYKEVEKFTSKYLTSYNGDFEWTDSCEHYDVSGILHYNIRVPRVGRIKIRYIHVKVNENSAYTYVEIKPISILNRFLIENDFRRLVEDNIDSLLFALERKYSRKFRFSKFIRRFIK